MSQHVAFATGGRAHGSSPPLWRRFWTAVLLLATCSAVGLHSGFARADPPEEPWWGTDKAIHFGAAIGISAAGYTIGVASFEDRLAGLGLGAGITIGLGAGKEILDAAGLGTPSWKDFTWDLLGTAVGLGLSIAFDAAIRGPMGGDADP